jgi:hypothetical protein
VSALHEILFARNEPTSPIGIEGIVAARPIYPSLDVMRAWLAALEQGLLRGDRSVVYGVLREAVPDFSGEADALCRLASGGSLSVRQLYTDDEEVLFQAARPTILGALLDVVAHGLKKQSRVQAEVLPRMADFALWAAGCETALWPTGTVARAYAANRQAAIEGVIEADPVAACVRDMMAHRQVWSGTASDFLRAADKVQHEEVSIRRPDWPRTPRALAGRLRRAQTSLRALGIELAFHREGRAGSRIVKIHTATARSVGTVSGVGASGRRPADRISAS